MNEGQANSEQPHEVGDSDRDQRERLADERDVLADEREASLDAREIRTAAHEAGKAGRDDEAQKVLADADKRDDQADARDSVAEAREHAASLGSFLHPEDEFDASIKARRSAAMDRLHSKTDRSSSAGDRSKLSENDRPAPDADGDSVS